MSILTDAIDKAWDEIVGKADETYHWLKGLLLGQFAPQDQSLKVMVADMIAGALIPGAVIVTSARDAAAVIVRMARDPEKREEVLEWILLCGCFITLALPIVAAAAGVVADGVGALVTGYLGDEAAVFLRVLILSLLETSGKWAVTGAKWLNGIVKGNLPKLLKMVKFSKWEKSLLEVVVDHATKLRAVAQTFRIKLLNAKVFGYKFSEHFDEVKSIINTLELWEQRFYSVQMRSAQMIPRAIGELDKRLEAVLEEILPKEAHDVQTGTAAAKPIPSVAEKPKAQLVHDPVGKEYREYDKKIEAEKKAAKERAAKEKAAKAQAGNSTDASAAGGHAGSGSKPDSAGGASGGGGGKKGNGGDNVESPEGGNSGGGDNGSSGNGGSGKGDKPEIKEKLDPPKQHVDGEHSNTKIERAGWEGATNSAANYFKKHPGFLIYRKTDERALKLIADEPEKYIGKPMAMKYKSDGVFIRADSPEKIKGLKVADFMKESKGKYKPVIGPDGNMVVANEDGKILVSDPDLVALSRKDPSDKILEDEVLGRISETQKETLLELNEAVGFHAFQHGPQENINMALKEDHFPLTAISEDGVEILELDEGKGFDAYNAFLKRMKDEKGLDYKI